MPRRLGNDDITRAAMQLARSHTDQELAAWTRDHAQDLVETLLHVERERQRFHLSHTCLMNSAQAGLQLLVGLARLVAGAGSGKRISKVDAQRLIDRHGGMVLGQFVAGEVALKSDDPVEQKAMANARIAEITKGRLQVEEQDLAVPTGGTN